MSSYRVGDRFRSKYGQGGTLAEITEIAGNTVRLVRWIPGHRNERRTAFELPLAFLSDKACGWKLEGTRR